MADQKIDRAIGVVYGNTKYTIGQGGKAKVKQFPSVTLQPGGSLDMGGGGVLGSGNSVEIAVGKGATATAQANEVRILDDSYCLSNPYTALVCQLVDDQLLFAWSREK